MISIKQCVITLSTLVISTSLFSSSRPTQSELAARESRRRAEACIAESRARSEQQRRASALRSEAAARESRRQREADNQRYKARQEQERKAREARQNADQAKQKRERDARMMAR
jgi:hypothetical protein